MDQVYASEKKRATASGLFSIYTKSFVRFKVRFSPELKLSDFLQLEKKIFDARCLDPVVRSFMVECLKIVF